MTDETARPGQQNLGNAALELHKAKENAWASILEYYLNLFQGEMPGKNKALKTQQATLLAAVSTLCRPLGQAWGNKPIHKLIAGLQDLAERINLMSLIDEKEPTWEDPKTETTYYLVNLQEFARLSSLGLERTILQLQLLQQEGWIHIAKPGKGIYLAPTAKMEMLLRS